MSFAWRGIFDNDHPVEVEIGPERGLFLLAMAALHPERNFFGIERSTTRTRLIEAALAGRALPNARVVSADAHCVLRHCVPAASVSVYHIYFPDPWWKRRHQRRRLLMPEFALLLERTLVPGGMLHLITDVREIFDLAVASIQSTSNLIPDDHPPPRPVRTAFEQKALRRGSPLHAVTFRRVPDASPRL